MSFTSMCSYNKAYFSPPLFPSACLDLYCTLEVDSFGYFVGKAKTRVFRDTTEPTWNEVSVHFSPSDRDYEIWTVYVMDHKGQACVCSP